MAIILGGCATGWNPKYEAKSSAELIRYVNRYEPDAKVWKAIVHGDTSLSGHYSSGDGLSGGELYLFLDSTYLYTHWADLREETVYDRGNWTTSFDLVTLTSDKSFSRIYPRDKIYVPIIHVVSNRNDLVLMGAKWDYSIAIEGVSEIAREYSDDPDFVKGFAINGIRRVETIPNEEAEELKAKLLKRVWESQLDD